jgi:hypothetical protein
MLEFMLEKRLLKNLEVVVGDFEAFGIRWGWWNWLCGDGDWYSTVGTVGCGGGFQSYRHDALILMKLDG